MAKDDPGGAMKPKLRLIQGGKGQPPEVLSGKKLLEKLRPMSHDEAAAFVIAELQKATYSRGGSYRVARLYIPGQYIEVLPGMTRSSYRVSVIARETTVNHGRRFHHDHYISSEAAETVTIAAFRLLELWDEET